MNNGWQTKKLGDACSFLNRGVSPKYVDKDGIVVLNQRCVRDHRVNYEIARRHDIKAKNLSSERLLQAGDVLVNSTGEGTLGRVAQLREDPPEPTTVDSHVTIVRPAPGMFFTEFFGYVLRDIEEELKKSGEGCGGQTELNRSVLAEKFLIRFPEALPEQQRIVGILDAAFEGIATAKTNAEKNLKNAYTVDATSCLGKSPHSCALAAFRPSRSRSPSLLLLPAARPNGARSARSARRSPIALCLLERYEVAPFFPCAPLPLETFAGEVPVIYTYRLPQLR